MPGRKNVSRLATMLGATLAASGIGLLAAIPASADVQPGTTARPAIEDCGTGAKLIQPSNLILTCADSGMTATRLHWTSWTSTTATATATVTWRATPGQLGRTAADVTLADPVREAGGAFLFTKLSLRVTGASPPGFIRDVTFNEAPVPVLPPFDGSPANGQTPGSRLAPAAASGTLNTAAIGGFWELAGGPSSVAETAEAITGAEASFDPGIIQAGMPYSLTGWGLWQITPGDSVPSYGQDYQLLDPWNNAEAAVYKYNYAGGFFPWTTWVDGEYLKYLQYASTPDKNLTDPGQYVPINGAPSGTHNGSDPGSTFGPPIPGSSGPPPTLAFKVVFQSNDNVLAGYSNSGANFSTTLGLKPGTSPSVTTLSDGTFEAAFEANNDSLGLNHLGGGTLNTTLGMRSGTGPAIAALPGGGWIAAFQDNDDVLYLYTSSGTEINTNLGMAAGTSPAIAVQANGSYKVVFQDNDHVLAGYNSSGSNFTTPVGMAAGTNPSIAAEPDGSYEVAVEANTDDLATLHLGTGISVNATTLGMDAGTSPAVAAQSDNTFRVIFQDNDNVLAGYNSDGSNFTTSIGMKAGTSPSITREPSDNYWAAVEANTDDLVTIHFGSGISVNPTTLGMDNATSPFITY